ncbi:MAG: hypothetical protein ACK56I_19475, partial [bacterium]
HCEHARGYVAVSLNAWPQNEQPESRGFAMTSTTLPPTRRTRALARFSAARSCTRAPPRRRTRSRARSR